MSSLKRIEMMKGAKKIVEVCGDTKPGENAMILTDTNCFHMAEVVAAAAHSMGAKITIVVMTPGKIHNHPVPEVIGAAMLKADVTFSVTTFTVTTTKAVIEARKLGRRWVNMPAFTEDMLIRGGIEADFLKYKDIVNEVAERIQSGKEAIYTTEKGTNLKLKIGRPAIRSWSIASSAEGEPHGCFIPCINAAVSPYENSAEGVIVVDGSINCPGIGEGEGDLLREPIKLTVKKGYVTEIEGGSEADKLRDFLASYEDQKNGHNVYNIAELSVHTNRSSKLTGNMMDDESAYEVGHIGIGANIGFADDCKIEAPLHLDYMIKKPSLKIDGKVLLDKGKLPPKILALEK